MTTTDWIIDLALILLVLRQIRESRLDRRFVLVPLGLVGWAAHSYLHAISTAGNDLMLIVVLAAAGGTLGLLSALATRVRVIDGHAMSKAGFSAATLWIVGVGSRLAFQFYASHGGAGAIERFSIHHDITGANTWADALVIMALSEVIVRLAVIVLRGLIALQRVQQSPKILVTAS
jgi:hypothetical protein